jgi:hypothetical protein
MSLVSVHMITRWNDFRITRLTIAGYSQKISDLERSQVNDM